MLVLLLLLTHLTCIWMQHRMQEWFWNGHIRYSEESKKFVWVQCHAKGKIVSHTVSTPFFLIQAHFSGRKQWNLNGVLIGTHCAEFILLHDYYKHGYSSTMEVDSLLRAHQGELVIVKWTKLAYGLNSTYCLCCCPMKNSIIHFFDILLMW